MKYLERLFLSSRWIVLFVLLCLIAFEHGFRNIRLESQRLNAMYSKLEEEKTNALAKRTELLLQINSEADLQWIELVLMEGLGLVPEGQTKVYFRH